MKIIAAAFVGCLLWVSAWAGQYDGVWVLEGDPATDYFVAYQNGSQLLVVNVFQEMDGWEANLGTFTSDNVVAMNTLLSMDAPTTATVEFSSTTTGTLTVHSCSDCPDIPLGVPLPIVKIY